MTEYYYKYVRPCDMEDIELKYFIYLAFHKLKEKLGVMNRYGTNNLLPVYFFKPVNPSKSMQTLFRGNGIDDSIDYDFKDKNNMGGFYYGKDERVGINPFQSPVELLKVLSHEVRHIYQDHLCRAVSDVCKERGIDESNHITTYDAITENRIHEGDANEFCINYSNWRTAAYLFYVLERGENQIISTLNIYDMMAYPPIKFMNTGKPIGIDYENEKY